MVTSEAAATAGLGHVLGTIAPGRAADVVVLERHHDDPWRNVVEAEPSWVRLVSVRGHLRYGRVDLMAALDVRAPDDLEQVVAWGTDMLLDTRRDAASASPAPATLAALRRALIAQLPQTGPIFA